MPSLDKINIGASAGDGTGDSLREAGIKINHAIDYLNANAPSLFEKHSTDVSVLAGQAVFIDTSSNDVTITLPNNPTFGDQIEIFDYAGSFGTNSCTVFYDGTNKINRLSTDFVLSTNDQHIKLVYVDSTVGWIVKQ